MKDRALVTFADGLVEELRENVTGALRDFDSDAIHDARVATRRLSASLELLAPVLSAGPRKKFGRVLKKLRGKLGPLRDFDVMIEHLLALASKTADGAADPADPDPSRPTSPATAGPHAPAIAWLVAHLEERRAQVRKKSNSKRTIPRATESLTLWSTLHDELADADEAAGTLLADSIHLQIDTFAERAADPKGSKTATAASPSAKTGESRHDPHALRKAAKALRYTLELADHLAHPVPAGTIRAFKKMQDALGLWHDYAVLAESAMHASMDQMLAYHDSVLQLQVLDLARYAVRRSARALTRFDRLWKRKGETLLAGIREAFPLTKDLTAQSKNSEDSPPASLEGTEENGSTDQTEIIMKSS